MKSTGTKETNSEYFTYEHRGVKFRCAHAFIIDALSQQNIDIISHIERIIDTFVDEAEANSRPVDFSIRVKIEKDIDHNDTDGLTAVRHRISVEKIPPYVD